MTDIKTLAEEAKRLFRLALEATDDFDDEWRINHAAKLLLTKSDAALDALAEAHQAEVATLNAEVERVRGICDRDNEMFRSTMQAGLAIREGLQAEVARLTRENEGLRAAGALMANTMFNLAQHPERANSNTDRALFKSMQLKWDAALAGASGAQG